METAREYFQIPTNCPECGFLLSEEGQFLYCRSKSCPVNLTGSLKVWVKRLGLLQWGDALIESITDPNKPHVSSIADVYDLSIDDLALHCSGVKVAKKVYDVLHANKTISLDLFFAALNIPNFGLTTATGMVESGCDSVDKVLSLSVEDLTKIRDIGKKTADSIYVGLQEKRELILALSSKLTLTTKSGPLKGCSVCITGTTAIPRKALEKKVSDFGGSVKSSVGNGLTYLITNDPTSGSSKMKNAQKYGTKIISEAEFLQLVSA